MSPALGQVTGDLWLQAHPQHHCPVPPSLKTQGSALPESSDSRKPGSELRGRIANPTLTYPPPSGGAWPSPTHSPSLPECPRVEGAPRLSVTLDTARWPVFSPPFTDEETEAQRGKGTW